MANKYLEKIAGLQDAKHMGQAAWQLAKANPLTVGLGLGGALDQGMSTTKRKGESNVRVGVRAIRNTLQGAATGAIAGKTLEVVHRMVRDKAGRNYK